MVDLVYAEREWIYLVLDASILDPVQNEHCAL